MFTRSITRVTKTASVANSVSKRGLALSATSNNTSDAMELVRENDFVDFRFTDLDGVWHHMTFPSREITEDTFENGINFDGSSIAGWKDINESDMVFKPDSSTGKVDPFPAYSTAVFICDIHNPDMSRYSRDPRAVVRKTADFLRSTGTADYVNMGPEGEFFVLDGASISNQPHNTGYKLESSEGWWNRGNDVSTGNLGYQIAPKDGYFPCPPVDQLNDLRNEMVMAMESLDLVVEAAHHEVGAAQCEIDIRFDELLSVADKFQWYKHAVRNVAADNGKVATFLPKPFFGDNGSGMHCHVTFHEKDGTNQFTGDGHCGLSEQALHFIGGIQAHARALCVLTNPSTNSYKRLVPGYEAPTNICYSACNRSAAVRIPNSHPKGRRIEYRTPDPVSNPYLAFSAIVMAGLDGVINKIDPGLPTDVDLYELSEEELKDIVQAPGSLDEAIDALKADRAWLEAGDVFAPDLVDKIIEMRQAEVNEINLRPHPLEFEMYLMR